MAPELKVDSMAAISPRAGGLVSGLLIAQDRQTPVPSLLFLRTLEILVVAIDSAAEGDAPFAVVDQIDRSAGRPP